MLDILFVYFLLLPASYWKLISCASNSCSLIAQCKLCTADLTYLHLNENVNECLLCDMAHRCAYDMLFCKRILTQD